MQVLKNVSNEDLQKAVEGFLAAIQENNKEVYIFENGIEKTLNLTIKVNLNQVT